MLRCPNVSEPLCVQTRERKGVTMFPSEDAEALLRSAVANENDPEQLDRVSAALVRLVRTKALLREAEAEARRALGPRPRGGHRSMTLHEAIALVLTEREHPMTNREIRREVEGRNLYVRRDGAPVGPNQIAARVRNYPNIFTVLENGQIALKADSQ